MSRSIHMRKSTLEVNAFFHSRPFLLWGSSPTMAARCASEISSRPLRSTILRRQSSSRNRFTSWAIFSRGTPNLAWSSSVICSGAAPSRNRCQIFLLMPANSHTSLSFWLIRQSESPMDRAPICGRMLACKGVPFIVISAPLSVSFPVLVIQLGVMVGYRSALLQIAGLQVRLCGTSGTSRSQLASMAFGFFVKDVTKIQERLGIPDLSQGVLPQVAQFEVSKPLTWTDTAIGCDSASDVSRPAVANPIMLFLEGRRRGFQEVFVLLVGQDLYQWRFVTVRLGNEQTGTHGVQSA